jgi:hypothetical protein
MTTAVVRLSCGRNVTLGVKTSNTQAHCFRTPAYNRSCLASQVSTDHTQQLPCPPAQAIAAALEAQQVAL